MIRKKISTKEHPDRPEYSTCSRCGLLKHRNEFARNQHNKGDIVARRAYCKECGKKMRPINIKNRAEYEKRHPRPKLNEPFLCPICKVEKMPWGARQITLDHDHKTGEIRGWVCGECNAGMGKLKDDVNILQRAIDWIKGILVD